MTVMFQLSVHHFFFCFSFYFSLHNLQPQLLIDCACLGIFFFRSYLHNLLASSSLTSTINLFISNTSIYRVSNTFHASQMKVYVPTMCILTDPENIVEGRVKVHMQRRTRVELPVT